MSFYNFGRAVTTAFVRIIYRLRFEGLENVPEDRGFILCSNHISDLDPILVAIRVKPQCFFMAKEELFKIPVLASIVRALGAFPVARGKGDTAAIDHAVDVVNSGHVLAIFPEGTRGKTESELELGEFHNGSFKMATKTGCPIIPLSISGSREILEAHFPKIRGTHVTVTYGKPIIPGELTKEEKKEIGNYTKNILLEQLKENA